MYAISPGINNAFRSLNFIVKFLVVCGMPYNRNNLQRGGSFPDSM